MKIPVRGISQHEEPNLTAASATKCFSCDSSQSSAKDNCISDPTKVTTCTSKGHCYIHISDEGVLRRGCVDENDKHVPTPQTCENKEDTCLVCSDRDNCNGKTLEVEYCFKMEYKTTSPIGQSEPQSKECPLAMNQLGCYHLEQNESVDRGCMSDLNKQKQNECKTNEDCELCLGKNCNSKVVRHLDCFHCDNTTDVNCAEPSELSGTIDSSNFSSSCLVGIDKNGYTHRTWGANKTYDTKRFPKGYDLCYNSTCNSKIYPTDRLKCYQCQGDDRCNLNTKDSKENLHAKACKIYSQNEHCFTFLDDGI